MRIVIESAEQIGMTSPAAQPTAAQAEAMDGGAPSTELVGTVSESAPAAAAREGINGGAPPEWLVAAIAEASQASNTSAGADNDGGSAPGSQA